MWIAQNYFPRRFSSCAIINHKLKQIAMKFIALPSVIFQQFSFSFTSEIKSQKTPKISHLSKRKKHEMIYVDECPYEGDQTLPNEFHIKRSCRVVYSTKYQSKFPNLSSLTRNEFSSRSSKARITGTTHDLAYKFVISVTRESLKSFFMAVLLVPIWFTFCVVFQGDVTLPWTFVKLIVIEGAVHGMSLQLVKVSWRLFK